MAATAFEGPGLGHRPDRRRDRHLRAELVTAIVATIRRERDFPVGNLIGSSVCDILFIFGITSLVPADGISVDPHLLAIDLPVMVAATVACVPVFLTGRRMQRVERSVFVAAYLVYLATLLLLRT